MHEVIEAEDLKREQINLSELEGSESMEMILGMQTVDLYDMGMQPFGNSCTSSAWFGGQGCCGS